jgi:hypothetical protein
MVRAYGRRAFRGHVDEVDSDLVDTDDLDIDGASLVSAGDFVGVGPSSEVGSSTSTTSTSYVSVGDNLLAVWDNLPSGAQGAIETNIRNGDTGTASYRLRNVKDSETVFEVNNIDAGTENVTQLNTYTPTTTASIIELQTQVKSDDGNPVRTDEICRTVGVQV